jgi:hypothetical protein
MRMASLCFSEVGSENTEIDWLEGLLPRLNGGCLGSTYRAEYPPWGLRATTFRLGGW